MTDKSNKQESKSMAASPLDDIDKVLKRCLIDVREDLRKSTQNPKLRREKIDAIITEREFK